MFTTPFRSKSAAIRSYAKKLPRALHARYGLGPYSEGQIHKTMQDLKLNLNFADYAVLMFCDEDTKKARFDQLRQADMALAVERFAAAGMLANLLGCFNPQQDSQKIDTHFLGSNDIGDLH